MNAKDIIKKQIKNLEIRSNKLVNEVFAGQYQSVFKGQGIEFAEVREYQIGDDFRAIDRNVSARHGKPFIKLFAEERELTILFLIDVSASQFFSHTKNLKSEIAAEVAAVLAFCALKNNDRVGMMSFTDRIEKIVAPKKGKNNILRIINEILDCHPVGLKTSISLALREINQIWTRRSVVFLISDFCDSGFSRDLRITAKRHDLICIKIEDEREKEIDNIGLVEMIDPETQETMLVDTSYSAANFKIASKNFDEKIDSNLTRSGLDIINLNTQDSYIPPLIKFFRNRQRRKLLG
ncbi:MAG: DUF58 domain-containing protein [Elusimicrobiota bacterium]|jgi:uncharacterized protein (DUF58 family)|nr:DUF58 domain-containing protein [Elusimicrobiota bacterium]